MDHQVVQFYWDVIAGGLEEDWSSYLLYDIATLWFTIGGFTVAGRLLEEYKTGLIHRDHSSMSRSLYNSSMLLLSCSVGPR